MRIFMNLIFAISLTITGCSNSGETNINTQEKIIGTWKWVRTSGSFIGMETPDKNMRGRPYNSYATFTKDRFELLEVDSLGTARLNGTYMIRDTTTINSFKAMSVSQFFNLPLEYDTTMKNVPTLHLSVLPTALIGFKGNDTLIIFETHLVMDGRDKYFVRVPSNTIR